MRAYVFPGQGSQFEGMGKDVYHSSDAAKALYEQANDLLGFKITDVMFEGSAEELKQTKITQPAIFLDSIVKARLAGESFKPDAVAGHSLGEFSALVAANAMSFEDGLLLVSQRAMAMQKACEAVDSTMAAIVGLDDEIVEKICAEIEEVVVPANYNSPGQIVISGTVKGVETAVEQLKAAGARMAIMLEVGGAFHSPLMQPAREQLQQAIEKTDIKAPFCPVYQNVTARPSTDPELIQLNLIEQLTAPVRWTQTMQNMLDDGLTNVIEVGGNGKVLRGLFKRMQRDLPAEAI